VGLRARVTCPLESHSEGRMRLDVTVPDGEREVYFSGYGSMRAQVRSLAALAPGATLPGPALVESPLSTIVIEPGTVAERAGASLVVRAIENAHGKDGASAHVDAVKD
jgi:N-methylhydantoinase A